MRIKTKVIQTPKGRLLVVGGLPENEKILRIVSGCLTAEKQDDNLTTTDYAIPSGNWQLLGKLPDITEEQAKEVVDVYRSSAIINGPLYLRYEKGECIWDLHTAKGSLLSLVECEVPLENSYGDYDEALKYYETEVWDKEQEKIFTNPILFIDVH